MNEEKNSSTCDDVEHREKSEAKIIRWKKRGKRGGQGKRSSQKSTDAGEVKSPNLGMTIRYGGKKPHHARLLGRFSMKILLVGKLP